MEDLMYETQEMSISKGRSFVQWFDEQVGTDRQVSGSELARDEAGNGMVYCMCFELTHEEVDMIRNWENRND